MELIRNSFSRTALLAATMLCAITAQGQNVVLTEDFSGGTNIFGATSTTLEAGSATVYDSGLSGFGKVLAACKTTAEGTLSGADGLPLSVGDGTLTAEWDAFHGYFGNARTSEVTLLNSKGEAIASYTYSSNSCNVSAVTIGGQPVPAFEAFAFQSTNGSNGCNGWSGNGRPYVATAGYNPHVAVTLTARGGVQMDFTLRGKTVTLLGSVGSMTKDFAKLRIVTSVENTDRCYAIDNIKVTTGELQQDNDYVEPIISAVITGAERMTFGSSTDVAFKNAYAVSLTGADGTLITEDNLNPQVTDFNVAWDIEGFKTANDTEGQYCDSYGAFSTNNTGKVATTFDLRDVPMNFFGKLTATITYNGTTVKAGKYVIAQGDMQQPATQILPQPGYPEDFGNYPTALLGYSVIGETYGAANDLITGGWCVAGSDGGKQAVLSADADGTKFLRFTATTTSKSHVMTQTIDAPSSQLVFALRLRFNNAGAVVTLTGGYPFWSSSRYTCPVSLSFDGTKLLLNGTPLTSGDAATTFTTGTWYHIVLSADKSSERCYALAYGADGQLLGQSGVLPWAETSAPTYFNVGMGNNNTGTVDMASCRAYVPTVGNFTLTADKTTLSIPQGDTALLTANAADENGYPVTQTATWTIVEEDMRQAISLTPNANDSHKATLSLLPTAEAGTATVQASIGGNTQTIALSLTSSAESIKFTQSTTSITIPMDKGETATARFEAIIIDGEGNNLGRSIDMELLDKEGINPFDATEFIAFDAATGTLSVKAGASPVQLTVRATGLNTDGDQLSKSVKVNIHGLKFDFGYADDDAVAEGFTLVAPNTSYSAESGYGIVSGTLTTGGTASDSNAATDYLQGAMQFNFKAQRGSFYEVEITYQGVLTTGYVNADLAGYELGTHNTLSTETYVIPATLDIIDLHVAAADATHVAQTAQVTITKQAQRQPRGKRVVHHIGDSTSANNGSWAYRLRNLIGTDYPELAALCDFHNDGAGGRNLSTYYTQGKLAAVLRDVYPDDVVMLGNNGTNGMGSSFEADVNYYLDAAEALGAQVILNSYTPHGAVANYASGYNASTHKFDSYRRDSYETVVRRIADERASTDDNYLGFVEIGMNADAIFNAYVADYAANGYANADAAAQAIIACFTDHNHYSNGTLACDLMLNGYATSLSNGIVPQLVKIFDVDVPTGIMRSAAMEANDNTSTAIYSLTGQRLKVAPRNGVYVKNGKKVVLR